MNTWQHIKSRLLRRHRHYDNGVSVYLDVTITKNPLTVHIEIPHDQGTDVYEIDMSTIRTNTFYSKIKTKGYYLHTKKKGA